MSNGVIEKFRSNNGTLIVIYCVTSLAVIGLVVGVVMLFLNQKRISDENRVDQNVTVAEESCKIIEQGLANTTEDAYATEVAKFEAIEEDGKLSQNTDFKNCYVSLRNYYKQIGNEEKMNYYNDIVSNNMMTEEDSQRQQELQEMFERGKKKAGAQ